MSKVKIKTPKEEWELKIYPIFVFELNDAGGLILWRRLVVWVKIAATLASHVLAIFVVA